MSISFRTVRRCCFTAAGGLSIAAWATWVPAGVRAQDRQDQASDAPADINVAERVFTAEEQALLEEGAAKNARVIELHGEGRHAEAAALAEEVLAILRQVVGEQHPYYASSLNNLASAYRAMGDFARAEPLHRQALEISRQVVGERHADYALSLNNLGSLYRDMGDSARAEPLFRQAVEIFKEALGEQDPRYATSLINLAELYKTNGDSARAEPLYRQAMEIRRQVLGDQHPAYATTLNNLANLYQSTSNYAQAEPLYREALEIRRQVVGEQHPDFATSLVNLAELYAEMGDSARAEPLFRQAVEIYKDALGEQHPDYATTLNSLANQYVAMVDFARAEPLLRQALEIRRQVHGEQHPYYALSLHNLAALYNAMGESAKAEPLYREALSITKAALGEDHAAYAIQLNSLAMLYVSNGDYARAEPLYRQVLEIRRQVLGEQHPDYAESLDALTVLYEAMGDPARAEPLCRQALEIYKQVFGEQHPRFARSLNNLAALCYATGDSAQAELLHRRALEIDKATLGENHPRYATDLNNLAFLYKRADDFARAEPLYQQAMEIYKQAVGEQSPDYARSLNNLAMLYYAMGDYARAEPLCRRALDIRRQVLGDQHPDYATSLSSLGSLYDVMDDFPRAEPLLREALEIATRHADATAAAQDELGQLALAYRLQDHLDGYLSCVARRGRGAAAAYRAALDWKGATLVRQRAMRLAVADPRLTPLVEELQTVVRQWSMLAAASDPAAKERLAELTARKEQLELELSRESAEFRAAAPADVARLQAALPADAALVDFFEFWFNEPSQGKTGRLVWRPSLAAFVVRREGDVQMFHLGDVAPIHDAIETWRRDIGVTPEAQAAGALLREKLWDPLVEAIGDAELVLVSPDGGLGTLPFAALPGKEPGTYLIEDAAIALVAVPRLIPELVSDAQRRELPRELLVLGGVDYDRRAGAEMTSLAVGPRQPWERGIRAAVAQQEVIEGLTWQSLPGTESEAAYIAGLYQRLMGLPTGSERIVHLRGAEATEEAFRGSGPECYLLHLATHGFFAAKNKKPALAVNDSQRDALRDNPLGDRVAAVRGSSKGLLSGLVLAGANDPPEIPEDPAKFAALPDDGILTAEEIAFLPLGGAQLVVLSACETGLGEVAGGEGLLGVQRAFQVAGARTTIATLWKVNDEATRRIMEEFYRNYLERRMPPLEALREAQLWALNNPDLVPRGADAPAEGSMPSRLPPQFWAAFTLSGDWR